MEMDMINTGLEPQLAAEQAVSVIGLGYDVCKDIRLSSSKTKVIEIDTNQTRDLMFPGGIVVPEVSTCIKCHQGERCRISSDVLSFHQMSEHFNQELSFSGKNPSGLFNAMFGMTNCWKKDAASTKSLAFDGWFITLYNVELDKTHIKLSENVKKEVPSSWDPAALAGFIEKYGTHVVVGVKMGGKDVVYVKQLRQSDLQPIEVQKLLKQVADERFSEEINISLQANPAEFLGSLKDDQAIPWRVNIALAAAVRPYVESLSKNEDIISISVRRGGIVGIDQHHNQWLSTISQSPNVISMSFVPITSLLNYDRGNGYLRYALNAYLRYKPPIEELHQFLDFQLPRHWAPLYDGFRPKHRSNMSPSLQFTFMGPKLYVNTVQVDSGNRPVTGIRLWLEGRKSDRLAIHLQHLSNLPSIFQISENHGYEAMEVLVDRSYYEPVKWKMFSHVCTAPVQDTSTPIDDSASIVTKARFAVRVIKMKKVLFLRLGFSTVASAKIRRSEWDGPSLTYRKSGFFSALMSTRLSKELRPPEKENEIEKPPTAPAVNDADSVNTVAPVPTKAPKMLNFVVTEEMVRGPDDTPGYWVVTGAKLCIEGGKISMRAKYSLLDITSGVSEANLPNRLRPKVKNRFLGALRGTLGSKIKPILVRATSVCIDQ